LSGEKPASVFIVVLSFLLTSLEHLQQRRHLGGSDVKQTVVLAAILIIMLWYA